MRSLRTIILQVRTVNCSDTFLQVTCLDETKRQRFLEPPEALRALILSIFSTMGSLLWTLLLLLILFYTFSCMFTQCLACGELAVGSVQSDQVLSHCALRLVTDHCRYTTIANTINTTSNTTTPNAIPKCPEELHHFSNVMDGARALLMSPCLNAKSITL